MDEAVNLAEEEAKAADRFLASLGLYRTYTAIFRVPSIWVTPGKDPLPPVQLTSKEVRAVQALWDAEWDRIHPPIKERVTAEKAAIEAALKVKRRIAEMEGERAREQASAERKVKDRIHHFNERMSGGFSEHHLYGPRGFKHPFKYEEVPAVWAMPTILPPEGVGGRPSYRPSRPLADDRKLAIVTAEICGDPPKGRSALEARAAHA